MSSEIPTPAAAAAARSTKHGPKRPTIGRGTSTLSADSNRSTSRPKVQRGTSTLSGDSNRSTLRPALQRGVSTLSSRSGKAVKTKNKMYWFRKVLNFAGHASLILMLGLYTLLGSYFFVRLELPNEKEVNMNKRSEAAGLKESFLNRVWDYTVNYTEHGNCSTVTYTEYDTRIPIDVNKSRQELNELLLQEIAKYERFVYEAADSSVALYEVEPDFNWNYAGAMFFSATIITTIGYGNIAPVTTNGRIFCIVYAIFGIPFTLIVVADLGKLFARFVVVCYKRCKRMMADRVAAKMAAEQAAGELPTVIDKTVAMAEEASARVSRMLVSLKVFGATMLLLLYIFLGAVVFSIREGWNLFESFYFCFITMTTIGLGDLVPQHPMFMLLCTVYILIGLAITSTCIELARSEYEKSWQRMVEASKRLQGLSALNVADALKQLGDHMELHGEIVDFDLLKDLRKAISGMRGDEIDDDDDDGDDGDDYDEPAPPTPPPPQKPREPLPPPPYIMYETTV